MSTSRSIAPGFQSYGRNAARNFFTENLKLSSAMKIVMWDCFTARTTGHGGRQPRPSAQKRKPSATRIMWLCEKLTCGSLATRAK